MAHKVCEVVCYVQCFGDFESAAVGCAFGFGDRCSRFGENLSTPDLRNDTPLVESATSN